MIRAVVDTNVTTSLFRGFFFGGVPLKIINAAISRRYTFVISPQLIEELERVLKYDKFGLSNQEIRSLLTPIMKVAEIVVPTTSVDIIQRCPGDNRVLECALDGKCDVITTGDRRDLFSIKTFHNIEILSARQFFEKYL